VKVVIDVCCCRECPHNTWRESRILGYWFCRISGETNRDTYKISPHCPIAKDEAFITFPFRKLSSLGGES